MKRALVPILAAALLLLLASCGGGSGSTGTTSTTPVSGLKTRALVSDKFHGVLYIIDAALNVFKGNTISVGGSAAQMALMPDKKNTIVLDPTANRVVVIDNTKETSIGAVTLPETPTSMAVSSDNKTVYVAVRNAPITGQLPGEIAIIDITSTTGALVASVTVPTVRTVVLNHNGSKLLAFSDNSNQVGIVDTTAKTVTYVGGFDHPVFGVFSTDDSTAYILSCGKECGGTTAKVNALTMTTSTVGPDVIVSGATTALLDSSNLYVAGNNGGGKLDIVNTGTMTVSKSGVAITDGYHSIMSLGPNGRLFIGSTGCGNTAMGCLSVYNTASAAVVNSAAGTGDVTGLQPITGGNLVYIVMGGELVFWDSSVDAPLPAAKQVDIVGQAYDVKLID